MNRQYYSFLLMLFGTLVSCWQDIEPGKKNYYFADWHFDLQDSIHVTFQVDTFFKKVPSGPARWNDSDVFYAFKYDSCKLFISYYDMDPKSEQASSKTIYQRQKAHLNISNPGYVIDSYNEKVLGELKSVYTIGKSEKSREIKLSGVGLNNLFEVQIDMKCNNRACDVEKTVTEIAKSIQFSRK